MSAIISSKELERKAFRTTFQDGLWDIYLGMLLLIMGAGISIARMTSLPPTSTNILLVVFAITVMSGFFLGKKYITVPRLGSVKFGPARRAKQKKVTLLLSLSALVGLAVLVSFGYIRRIEGVASWVIPFGMFGITSVVVFSLGTYYLDYTRAYLYGWCYALAFPVGIFLQNHTDLGFLLSYLFFSAIMLVPGVVLLIRFLRDYPVVVNESGEALE